MKSLFIAFQFLTRIPLPWRLNYTPQLAGRSLLWYPLVGLVIGAILYGLALLLKNQSPSLVAALMLVLWVLITGGLHLDGLADSADAWAGGFGDKQKTLDIMKDPNVGSIAVVMLILILLLKFVALNELLRSNNVQYIIMAPMLGRCAVVILFLTTPYVRKQGLGSDLAVFLPRPSAFIILALFLVPVLYFKALAMIGMLAVLVMLRYLMLRRIEGMTGDTIGAAIEIIEATVVMAIVL